MPDINGVKRLIDLAVERGLGSEWLSAEHDVIYLPFDDENDPVLNAMRDDGMSGLHYDTDIDCWAVFT